VIELHSAVSISQRAPGPDRLQCNSSIFASPLLKTSGPFGFGVTPGARSVCNCCANAGTPRAAAPNAVASAALRIRRRDCPGRRSRRRLPLARSRARQPRPVARASRRGAAMGRSARRSAVSAAAWSDGTSLDRRSQSLDGPQFHLCQAAVEPRIRARVVPLRRHGEMSQSRPST